MKEGDDRPAVVKLLANIKANMPALLELRQRADDEWGGEDGFYRYYHGSYKTYRLQDLTLEIVELLRKISPKPYPLNEMFMEIISDGTGRTFELSHNENWSKHTRPIVEAYCHARWFMEMMVKYGQEEVAPCLLPTGWAAVLHLYNLR